MVCMVEICNMKNTGFAYGSASLNQLSSLGINYSIEYSEKCANNTIFSITLEHVAPPPFASVEYNKIFCSHGKELNFDSINYMPHCGWEDLVDCWSCHDSEFNSMLSLQPKARPGGILMSDFYLSAGEKVLPPCCTSSTKIELQSLKTGHDDKAHIFRFFSEYFNQKNKIVIEYQSQRIEVKKFYDCLVIHEGVLHNAIKIGFRESIKEIDFKGHIPEYYNFQIFEMITRNSLGLNVLNYSVSFIY
ncbi:hypothetical protein ENBRE01_0854 [Enteropsectra breve]|nr:hypothetical protein ENBRE01_0854 [Enteropsectra breve]